MARALWLLALLSAFFVVAVRCLSGVSSSSSAASGTQACAILGGSADEDEQTAAPDVDDDSDDSTDPLPALAAGAPAHLVTFTDTKGTRLTCGALVARGALPSHAASLERPPRG